MTPHLQQIQYSRVKLSYLALHNVFENINPNFLKPEKNSNEESKLGLLCY